MAIEVGNNVSKACREFIKSISIPHGGNRGRVLTAKAHAMSEAERGETRAEILRLREKRRRKFLRLKAPPIIMESVKKYLEQGIRVLDRVS